MKHALTIREIRRRYDSEWVLVGEPELSDTNQVRKGKVLFHSKDRDEVYRRAVELQPGRFAMLYTGKMPKDVAIVL